MTAMPERDPFGRLPDENPLAGLGSLSDGSDRQDAAEPVASARPARVEEQERTRPKPDPPPPSPKPRASAGTTTPPRTPSTAPNAQQQQLRELLGAVEQMKRGKASVSGVGVLRSIGRVLKIVRIVVFLAIVVAIGSVALGLFSSASVKERIDDVTDIELPNLEGPVTPAEREPEPAGLRG
jgi:hypothetical protein